MNAQQIAANNLRQQLTQELGQVSMELPEARSRIKRLEQRDIELRTAISTLNAIEKETANVQSAIDKNAAPAAAPNGSGTEVQTH